MQEGGEGLSRKIQGPGGGIKVALTPDVPWLWPCLRLCFLCFLVQPPSEAIRLPRKAAGDARIRICSHPGWAGLERGSGPAFWDDREAEVGEAWGAGPWSPSHVCEGVSMGRQDRCRATCGVYLGVGAHSRCGFLGVSHRALSKHQVCPRPSTPRCCPSACSLKP